MKFPELYILRHGQTVWNAENRMQGELNSPLTKKGEQDAARQAKILAQLDLTGFDFLCSPQGRAVQTAAIALVQIADAIHTDNRLREIGVGAWSGKLRDDLPMPDSPDPFLAQYEMAPDGEGSAAVEVRVRAFLTELKRPSVLVTHGITSRIIRRLVAGEEAVQASSIHGGQGVVYHLKEGQQNLLT